MSIYTGGNLSKALVITLYKNPTPQYAIGVRTVEVN